LRLRGVGCGRDEEIDVTKRSSCHQMSDLDVAGVIEVHAERRRLTAETGHAICGEFIGFGHRRRVHVCSLPRLHSGRHL